jgi:hypothetical protein
MFDNNGDGDGFGTNPYERHPTLSVGRRRVQPKLFGLWRKRISFLRFDVRRKPFYWLSVVIFYLERHRNPSRR